MGPVTKRRATGAVVVAVCAALVVLPASHYAGLPMDEGLLLLYPELVLRGMVPNRDFLMSYGPGDIWLLASMYSIFGVHVGVERIVGLALHVLVATAVFAHASRWGSTVAVIAGLIAGVMLIPLGAVAFAFVVAVALVLWALFLVARQPFLAGVLAGLALLCRPELGPATALALLPAAAGLDRSRRLALIGGASLALLPFAVHALIAGPAAVIDNLVLGVFKWGPGRALPLPGQDPLLLSLVMIADAVLVSAAILMRRAEDPARARTFAGLAVFSVLTLPQALQRADIFHLVQAGTLPVALLPASFVVLLGRIRRPFPAVWRESIAVLIAALLIATGASRIVDRAATLELPRALGLETASTFLVLGHGRVWYPLRASVEYTLEPIGSPDSAAELQQTVDDVDRIAASGARLFVGPLDLRRTNIADTMIYHLLPQLVPATYYLEMAPGSTNGPDSHLAADIATADILVLTSRYDDWREPNASQQLGPDEPNAVVRERFELRARHGTYAIYTRRAAAAPSARDAVTLR